MAEGGGGRGDDLYAKKETHNNKMIGKNLIYQFKMDELLWFIRHIY